MPDISTMTTLFIVLALSCGLASSIKIDVTSIYSDNVIQDSINIKCVVEKDKNCEKSSYTIQLTKGDDTKIASIQGQNGIDYGRLHESNTRAEGHIDEEDSSRSYLSVTIDHVVKEDSGVYTCSLFYLDNSGNMKVEKASENVTIGNQHSEDLIRYLFAKVTSLESLVASQNEIMENQIAEIKNLQEEQGKTVSSQFDLLETMEAFRNQAVKDSIDTALSRIDWLEEKEKEQIQDMQDTLDKAYEEFQNAQDKLAGLFNNTQDIPETSPIAFRARYSDYNLVPEEVLRFTTVDMNLGEAYNPEDGIFTAPRAGLYVFHITIMTRWKYATLAVRLTSEKDLLLNVHASGYNSPDQSSGGSVVYLEEGEKVWPYITAPNNPVMFSSTLSNFCGYLLHPMDAY